MSKNRPEYPGTSAVLYLLRSDNYPDLGDDIEALLIEDDDAPESDGSTEGYACLTTLVYKGEDSPDVRQAIDEWWKELGGASFELEILATDLSMMSPDQRVSIAELEPMAWSIRTSVVLFPRDSAEKEATARQIVLEAALSAN